MSVYAVNKIGYRIWHEDSFREAVLADPAAALAELDLTDDERAALLAGDVGALYHLGAHEYLLFNLAKAHAFGLTVPQFVTRMRAAGTRDPSAPGTVAGDPRPSH